MIKMDMWSISQLMTGEGGRRIKISLYTTAMCDYKLLSASQTTAVDFPYFVVYVSHAQTKLNCWLTCRTCQ